MLNYFKKSIQRKIARRVTKEYPATVTTFTLEKDGPVQFANWDNPLVKPFVLEQHMVDFFRKFIKPGDLAIDIGANIGDTTVPMALAAAKEGTVLGFDPNPYVFKILEKNASLNQDKTNIIPLPNAISVSEEEFYFISSEASFGNGGISPTRESIHGKYIYPHKIKGINLSTYLEKNHASSLSKLSFIKIDTEGYDKEIIKSIKDVIRKCKPAIVAESFGRSSDEAKMELFEVISMESYNVFFFEDFDAETPVTEIKSKEEMTKWKDTINIYAVPR